MDKKVLCNYHFVAEAIDVFPENIKTTKCTGLTMEESEAGLACSAWDELMAKEGYPS